MWYYCAIGFICCEIDTLSSFVTAIYFYSEKLRKKAKRVETGLEILANLFFLWHIENPFYGTKTYLSCFFFGCCCRFRHCRNDVKIRVRFFSFLLVFCQNNIGWHELNILANSEDLTSHTIWTLIFFLRCFEEMQIPNWIEMTHCVRQF